MVRRTGKPARSASPWHGRRINSGFELDTRLLLVASTGGLTIRAPPHPVKSECHRSAKGMERGCRPIGTMAPSFDRSIALRSFRLRITQCAMAESAPTSGSVRK